MCVLVVVAVDSGLWRMRIERRRVSVVWCEEGGSGLWVVVAAMDSRVRSREG